ncbi:MAG: hypothetical protein JST87_08675 [Bacteroidetes bacterium]|nr:hypothetical protein [Bacteroidota bacterium]
MRIFLTIAFISFILISCGGGSGDAITLKFNLGKGSKMDYSGTVDMHISENVMGNNINVQNKMRMGYLFEVTNDSAGWKTLNSTISRISMDMNANGQSLKFDTDSATSDTTGPTGMMLKIFGAMKGGQFAFTMDDKGHVGEVTGMREMMEHALANINVPNSDMIMRNMGKSFDASNFKQNLEQSFAMYPDKPVKPGDTWTRTSSINSNGMPVKMENTYTLNSVSGNVADVKVSSKLSSGADSSSTGVKELTGTMTGDTHYDVSTGVPVDGNMEMKMTMKVNAQGQEIPVNMVMNIASTGKKL